MKSLMLKLIAIAVLSFVMPLAPVAADQSGIITDPACQKTQDAGGDLPGCTTADADGNVTQLDPTADRQGYLSTLLDAFIYVATIVSVLFIMIGGIQYMTTTGDAGRIEKAKNTVLYAIIGLIVALLARAIIGFIIDKV